jgi:hypothetical protein
MSVDPEHMPFSTKVSAQVLAPLQPLALWPSTGATSTRIQPLLDKPLVWQDPAPLKQFNAPSQPSLIHSRSRGDDLVNRRSRGQLSPQLQDCGAAEARSLLNGSRGFVNLLKIHMLHVLP